MLLSLSHADLTNLTDYFLTQTPQNAQTIAASKGVLAAAIRTANASDSDAFSV